uniref:Uncharacterized protein n=1 Tax=Hyaloperonospora arabidopsidis (strain Emoy2) TaxID=559515 RepID=M4BU81_HYAAE
MSPRPIKSLPDLIAFERLKSSIYYGADPSIYTAARVRKLILAASARQKSFGAGDVKRKRKVSFAVELTTLVWTEVINTRIVLVN